MMTTKEDSNTAATKCSGSLSEAVVVPATLSDANMSNNANTSSQSTTFLSCSSDRSITTTTKTSSVVFALFKPRKLIVARAPPRCATAGKEGRRGCLTSWLAEMEEEASLPANSLYTVGRLDKDTSGLLLVTNDGDLVYALTRQGACAKRYVAVCMVKDAELQESITGERDVAPWSPLVQLATRKLCTDGVHLSEQSVDRARAVPATMVRCEAVEVRNVRTERREVAVKADRSAQEEDSNEKVKNKKKTKNKFGGAPEEGGAADHSADDDGVAQPPPQPAQLRTIEKKTVDVAIDIKVGLYRVVRRILAAIGLPVFQLSREAIGPLVLGQGDLSGLVESQHVRLTEDTVSLLWQHVGGRQSLAANKAYDNARSGATSSKMDESIHHGEE